MLAQWSEYWRECEEAQKSATEAAVLGLGVEFELNAIVLFGSVQTVEVEAVATTRMGLTTAEERRKEATKRRESERNGSEEKGTHSRCSNH